MVMSLSLSAQIDRTQMPAPGPAPEINLKEPQSFELANGLKVMVVEDSKLPRVSIQLLIDNPPIGEGDKAGVSTLMGSLLGNGSTSINKDEFNEEIDFMGARMSFGSQSGFASSLSKYFPRLVELMADAAINPNFTEEEFEKEKSKLLTAIKSQENDVSAIHGRMQNALAYSTGHPYGEFITEASINNVTLPDIKTFYLEYFVPANAYLVIIGDVSFENVEELVTRYFLAWTKSSHLFFGFTDPLNTQFTQINIVDMPNAVQSEITMQNLVNLKKSDEDYLPSVLANHILGGGGQARLFLNLREDKAFTYGSYSRLGNDKYAPALFRASASVRNAVTDSAVVEIVKEIERIVKEPVTEEELKNAKAEYVGSFVMALEKPQTIARYALNIETENLPKDYYKTYLERLNAVTVEEVQEAAQKHFSVSNSRIIVTGKGSEISENLEKVPFNGRNIPVYYFDKTGAKIDKPDYSSNLPEGVTLATVIDQYLNAIGGKDKIASIQTLKLVYEGTAMGTTVKTEERRTTDKYAQTTYMNGSAMMGVVSKGDEFYMKQGANKVPLPPAMQNDLAYSIGILPELGMVGSENAKLIGIENVEGKEAYKVEVNGEIVQSSFFYDVETGLKLREMTIINSNGQQQKQTVNYKDYQEFEGIKIPGLKIGNLGTEILESKLLEASVNAELTDADFE